MSALVMLFVVGPWLALWGLVARVEKLEERARQAVRSCEVCGIGCAPDGSCPNGCGHWPRR